jgi:hypothetical protein
MREILLRYRSPLALAGVFLLAWLLASVLASRPAPPDDAPVGTVGAEEGG